MKYIFLVTIIFISQYCFGKDSNEIESCNEQYLNLDSRTINLLKIRLPVYKCYFFKDNTGEYYLYLTEQGDKVYKAEKLSSSIEARLYKKTQDGSLNLQWTIRDFSSKEEAGVYFKTKQCEIVDIDGDGIVEPIVVYRFFNKSDVDSSDFDGDSFSGKIKIIMYYKGSKVAIRAKTSIYDGEKETSASATFFTLPPKVRIYLVSKMESMYNNRDFGFDNSFKFIPRRLKGDN
jgi:hypothetical protein